MKTIEAKVKISSPVTAASCSVVRKYVSSVSGNYVIDPDGEGGLAPFTVFCDMTDKNGVGVTVVSHDSESRTYVKGYIGPGSYSRNIRELKQTRRRRLTRTSQNKSFNWQNNDSARVRQILVHFFAVLCKTTT